MFSLEWPQGGDSNEYTQHAIINIKKEIRRNNPKYNNVCRYGIFCQGVRNEFETALVNKPSVCKPLKIYGIYSAITVKILNIGTCMSEQTV